MKKSIMMAALFAVVFGLGAAELAVCSNYTEVISVQERANVIYDGPAYSAGSGMIPKAVDSVNVYWTDEGCTANGRATTAFKISGGTFTMGVNGRLKEMTHYVNYGGERYYFAL